MPRPRQARPDVETLERLYAELGSVRALGEKLGASHTSAAKWLDEAGIERKRVGRPRTRGHVGQLTLRLSEVEYAGLLFRARQRQMSLRAVTAAIVAETLAAGRDPAEPSGPPERSISPLLPVEVLDRLHVEADRRAMSVTALALGLALTAVPE